VCHSTWDENRQVTWFYSGYDVQIRQHSSQRGRQAYFGCLLGLPSLGGRTVYRERYKAWWSTKEERKINFISRSLIIGPNYSDQNTQLKNTQIQRVYIYIKNNQNINTKSQHNTAMALQIFISHTKLLIKHNFTINQILKLILCKTLKVGKSYFFQYW
jgi:hypothetical protein